MKNCNENPKIELTEEQVKEICPEYWNVCILCGICCFGLPCYTRSKWLKQEEEIRAKNTK